MTMLANKVTYSEPSIQYLQHVLEMVATGALRIPRFQRPFIWLEDRQLELMRSIREGIPIGALMIWRTTNAPVAFYDTLGGFPLSADPSISPQQYILDGVQRITTLYGALADWRPMRPGSGSTGPDRVLYFSFADDDFVFAEPDLLEDEFMPMGVVFKTMELIKYQRHLSNVGRDEWIEVASELASRFKDYKVPLLSINTDDLSIATSTFQRVNTQGARMTDFHMIHALTWTNQFDLQQSLQNLKAEHLSPILWGDVDDEIILKVCKGLRGLNLYKSEPKEISKLIRDDPGLLERAVKSVRDSAYLLKDTIGIPSPDFVPYAFQIIFISLACAQRPRSNEDDLLIRNWIWFTTYTEAFSGMSDDRVKRALSDFVTTLTSGIPKWSNTVKKLTLSEPKERFDFRSVRSKATFLALARHYDEAGGFGFKLLQSFGRSTVQQLFTRDISSVEANSPGNKIFLPPNDSADFRLAFELEALSDDNYERHFLHPSMQSFSPAEIIRARAKAIAEYEEKFASIALSIFLPEVL